MADPDERRKLLALERAIVISSEVDWERHYCWDVTEWVVDATAWDDGNA